MMQSLLQYVTLCMWNWNVLTLKKMMILERKNSQYIYRETKMYICLRRNKKKSKKHTKWERNLNKFDSERWWLSNSLRWIKS